MSLFLNSQTGVKNSKSESGFMLNLNISPAFLYCLEYGEFEFIIFTVWISMKKKKTTDKYLYFQNSSSNIKTQCISCLEEIWFSLTLSIAVIWC